MSDTIKPYLAEWELAKAIAAPYGWDDETARYAANVAYRAAIAEMAIDGKPSRTMFAERPEETPATTDGYAAQVLRKVVRTLNNRNSATPLTGEECIAAISEWAKDYEKQAAVRAEAFEARG